MNNSPDDPLADRFWNVTRDKISSVLYGYPLDLKSRSLEVAPILKTAIEQYRYNPPPFVINTKNQKERCGGDLGSKTVTLAEHLHGFGRPREIKVDYRTWDDVYGFWTLDLDGKRSIVKVARGAARGGAKGGASWRVWSPTDGYNPRAVAFSCSKKTGKRLRIKGDSIHDGSSQSLPLPPQSKPVATKFYNGVQRPDRSSKTRAQKFIQDTVDYLDDRKTKTAQIDNITKARKIITSKLRGLKSLNSNVPGQRTSEHPIRANLPDIRQSSLDSEQQPRPNTAQFDEKSVHLDVALEGDSVQVSPLARRRREVFSSPNADTLGLGSKRRYETLSITDPESLVLASKRRRELLCDTLFPSADRREELCYAPEQDQPSVSSVERTIAHWAHQRSVASARSDPVPEVISVSDSDSDSDVDSSHAAISSNQRHRNSGTKGSPQDTPASKSRLVEEPDKPISSLSHNSITQEPSPLSLLARTKISNTFLLVTVPPSPDFKIAKLSSCLTVSDITNAILKPFKMEKQIDLVDSFRFKFEWLPANAQYRTVLIEPDQMVYAFDYVLRGIDNADLWNTGDQCNLGVEILLRDTLD